MGGSGSGKSVFAAQKKIVRSMSERGHSLLCLRKVKSTIRGSVFQELKNVISESNLTPHFKEQKVELSFEHIKTKSRIFTAGLDDPEKLKSISRVTSVWIEEATELSENDFHQVDLRLRGQTPSYKQIILSFNPIDEHHWLKRMFFDQQKKNAKTLVTTVEDNLFAAEEDYELLESLPEDLRLIYRHAKWGREIKGIIYHNWDTNYGTSKGELIYGLDFGYNNPTALTEIFLSEREAWISKKIYQTKLTNQDLIDLMKELNIDKQAPIYADSSEPQRIAEIYDAGYNIREADKSVSDGVLTVKEYSLHINPEDVEILDEIRYYKWDEDKHGNSLERPVKFKDHAMDSIRYGIHSHRGENLVKSGFAISSGGENIMDSYRRKRR